MPSVLYSCGMPTKQQTAGQTLTARLRTYLHVGPRTRVRREGANVKEEMLELIEYAASADCTHEATQALFASGIAAVRSHRKHYDDYRIDGVLRYQIECMSPWQFAALLGEMIDAGVTNVGEGERFYAAMRKQVAA